MSEIMTFKEIEQKYDGQWVLIAYTETNEDLQVVKGTIVAHSNNKEDIYRALADAGDRPLAIEYIGQIPEDLAFIL